MKIGKNGSTMRQQAYARRIFTGDAVNKKQVALDVGYTHNVASSAMSKIETRKGFHNAMARLAADSNQLALSVMHEFKARGFEDFSNKDLVASLNAIAGAWRNFNKGLEDLNPKQDDGKNRLRTVILQNISKQVMTTSPQDQIESPAKDAIKVEYEEVPDLDF